MSNQPSEELKPCPFCKSKAIIGKFSDDYQTTGWAECTKSGCSASIEVDGGEQKAIAAWNTRKGEDERIAQAVGIEKREARLNLENRMKEQLLEAVQAEREQIIKRLNRQIIGYIQDKSLDFETTATLKEATDIAIKIVKGE